MRYFWLWLLGIMMGVATDLFGNREVSYEDVSRRINSEYLKLKAKYEMQDSMLFVDIIDVVLAIKTHEKISDNNKVVYLKYIENFLVDANTSIFSSKKVSDGNYRRAIRFFPTLVYYSESNDLKSLAPFYAEEILNALLLVPNQNILKQMILRIGIDQPQLIFKYIDELYNFPFINEVVEQMIKYYPKLSIIEADHNPLLLSIAAQSNDDAVRTCMSIRQRYGSKSDWYHYLDAIQSGKMTVDRDIDFYTQKQEYTKILLKIAQDEGALGRYGTIDYLSKVGKWVLLSYLDHGEEILKQYSENEIFMLMAMNIKLLNKQEVNELKAYLSKPDKADINQTTVTLLPNSVFASFVKSIQNMALADDIYALLDIQALNAFLEREKYADLRKPALKNQYWLNSEYDYQAIAKAKARDQKNKIAKTFHLNKIQYSMLKWTRNLNKVDSNLTTILNSAIGKPFLNYMCTYQPHLIFNNKDKLKDRSDFDDMISKICFAAPNSIKKYLSNSNHEVYLSVSKNKLAAAQTLMQIYEKYQYKTKAYTLLDPILRKQMTIEQANAIGQNQILYLKNLCAISSSKNPYGLHSVEAEQNELSLQLIREINDRPSSSNATLNEIKGFGHRELYSLMILGREELFDFTFNQFFSALMSQSSGYDLIQFMESVNYYKFREFANLLAEFDKLTYFLNSKGSEAQQKIWIEKLFTIDFSNIHALEHAANLSELIAKCTDPKIQEMMQHQIKSKYEQVSENSDQLGMAIYSLLASNIGKRSVIAPDFFKLMEDKYSKHTYTKLKVKDLIQNNQKIIITSYFYNDADGVSSFNSFINSFKSSPQWYMKDLGSYYYLSSVEGLDIDFFANKPQYEKLGQEAIKQYLTVNKLEPSIIVHRGHSYHSHKTIEQMVGSPKFIFMGSCGGYYKIPDLLERSPNAQILSTKQVGTMSINDPIIKLLVENIRNNRDIDWVDFWETQRVKFSSNKDFKDYVPPHKNNGALFVNAFFDVVGIDL